MLKYYKIICLFAFSLFFYNTLSAQDESIDKVIAVVGKKIVLKSDVEKLYLEYKAKGITANKELKCKILKELIFQKLLVNQAALDSLEVNDNQVLTEMNRRIQYFISQVGSQEKLEEYFKKSIYEIKNDLKESIAEQMLAEQVKGTINQEVQITPSETKKFFATIPKDSLPLINTKYEIQKIVLIPEISAEEINKIKSKLESYKKRIEEGDTKFSTLARLYSEDKESAKKGGEIGLTDRNNLDPDFLTEASRLQKNQVSRVVKSQFGYHIIKLVAKRGGYINVKHILLTPEASVNDKTMAINKLDSIRVELMKDSAITFEKTAEKFSDDENTKNNGGLYFNQYLQSSKIEADNFDIATNLQLKKMKVGEVSEVYESVDDNRNQVFQIIKLKNKIEAHELDLRLDYKEIQNIALENKKQENIQKWFKEKYNSVYIKIDDEFSDCEFDLK